jgi:hypothetical protein
VRNTGECVLGHIRNTGECVLGGLVLIKLQNQIESKTYTADSINSIK